MRRQATFGTWSSSFAYAGFFLATMWLFFWAQHLFAYDFYKLGVLPRTFSGLIGLFFMPFIHSKNEIEHIVNNSIPAFLLMSALFYYYRAIAWRVLILGWLFTGAFLWIFAHNFGRYHIGMSGVIYFLASFLFVSGVLRKYLPLQVLSLFIVFLYGSMVWGIFPMQEKVSWEGHFSGMLMGVIMAFFSRQKGPQRPKYQYEVEKELGIEPPDLEGMYYERLRELEEEEKRRQSESLPRIIYHYTSNDNPRDKDATS
jgi:membrane associated rhomboid family serine protease